MKTNKLKILVFPVVLLSLLMLSNLALASEVTGTLTTGLGSGMSGVVVVAPTANPAGGTYHSTQSVSLTNPDASSIRYTVNGNAPACDTSSALYTSPISVASDETIKAVSCYPNSKVSDMAPFAYTFTCAAVSNGSASGYPTCAITCNSGYALSGSSCVVITTSGNNSGGGGGGSYTNPYTVTINGGAPQTVSANVTLALTALAGMNQMWISNDYSFTTSTGTGWIPFQATYPWTLTSGSGNKTVYVEFKSASAATSAGSAQASITFTGGSGGTGGTSGTSGGTGGGTSGTLSASQLQLLNLLIAQLRLLLQQALAQGIPLPPGAAQFLTGTTGTAGATGTTFTRNLYLGSQGEDVRQLQVYLNAHGFTVAASGPGSPGNETTRFGWATQAALAAFQKSVGITPASGYFGPTTRAYVNSHP